MAQTCHYDGADQIIARWREGLTPEPALTVSTWSDQYRVLSTRASAESGRWRTTRTPYLREIMDCLSPSSTVERVVFMKGAQIGATEMGLNWIGFVIQHAPGPMMAVWPTVDMAKRASRQRLDALIEDTPVIQERIAPARARDSGNTVLSKEFQGGVLILTGANSAVGLRSMPVRYLFLDEVDGYPRDVEGEGDAIALAEARTRTFARRKLYLASTPTLAGASAIAREYEASDQRRYMVPCPHCGHYQWLRFAQLRWPRGEPASVLYHCEACDTGIAEHHKTTLLAAGVWLAMAPKPRGRVAGFHLSALYSPLGWRSWRDIAADYEAAYDPETGTSSKRKSFTNTDLGETWIEDGEAPDWQRLLERRENYRIGRVPAGGLLLTAGADIQGDRIEVSVWAFGRGLESWLIEHRVMMGDTAHAAVWKSLAGMLAETWTHASGVSMPLTRLAVDSGYATQTVYAFARRQKNPRLMVVKGTHRGAALIGTPTAVEVSVNGKKLRRGIKLYHVAGGIAKLELYANLHKTAVLDGETWTYPEGYVHLPMIDSEFVQQLCAEQYVGQRNRHGYTEYQWQKLRERNEALDCYTYARAAAAAVGVDRFEDRHWDELAANLAPETADPPPPAPAELPVMPDSAPHAAATGHAGPAAGRFADLAGPGPTVGPNSAASGRSGRRVIGSSWMKR